jgi:transposase
MKQPELVTASQAELDDILTRTKAVLPEQQYKLLEGVLRTFAFVMLRLQDAKASVGRLRRMLFGARTESLRNVIEDTKIVKDGEPGDEVAAQPGDSVVDEAHASSSVPAVAGLPKAKGHGRNGVDALRGATIVPCEHDQLRAGQRCPQCDTGKIYECPPSTVVRFSGQPPIAATVYRRQRLRCRLCDTVYTAVLPAGVSAESKYDASCSSMLAVLRYGSGMPFYRLQGLQASVHVPLPDATQWDIVKEAVDMPKLVYAELIRQAAQAPLLHNDDTPARVLALMKARKQAEAASQSTPKAINTTGIVALLEVHRVVLFITGHAHAGQNLEDVLAQRARELAAPMQMCDALAANMAGDFTTVLCHCLAHGRRKVIDVLEHFPEQGRHILEVLGRVYAHDAHCSQQQLSPEQRLAYHQEHSAALMQGLQTWMNERFAQREAEPSSGLGQAMKYLLKHWQPLTLFLRRAGAPLDNSICERALKRAILHRKNSLFYKTVNGAEVGDIYMSVISTCVACGANALEYLQALQLNAQCVQACVAQWLPWNYREQLAPQACAAA